MSLIIAMCLFAVSMSISPGPVNLVTFSSGLNYGFVPTLPFVAGAALGFAVLLVVVGLGLGEIVALSPVLMQVLAYAGARLSKLVSDRSSLQWCNRIMGGLLVLVAFYLLYLQL